MKTRTIALGAAVVVAASILAVACAAEDAAAPHCYGAGRHDVLAPAAVVKPVPPPRHAAPAPAKQPAAPARPVHPAAPTGAGHSSPRASLSKAPAAPAHPTSPWAATSSPSSHRPHHPAPHHHAPHQHVEIDLDGDDC